MRTGGADGEDAQRAASEKIRVLAGIIALNAGILAIIVLVLSRHS